MNIYKDISTATASRDLKMGLELSLIHKIGTKNKTNYKIMKYALNTFAVIKNSACVLRKEIRYNN